MADHTTSGILEVILGMTQDTQISFTPLTGSFGAEVKGVDLAEPINEKALQVLKEAWIRYQVLFFRDQEITPDQQIGFARRFGELTTQGYMPKLDGNDYVWVQEYPALFSRGVNDITWHADSTFLEKPSKGSVLYALDVPESGGDTIWADMCAAYEALSDAMQTFLSGLTAMHDNMHKHLERLIEQMGPERFAQMRHMMPPTAHPVVRTHPESGRKCLFVSELMTSHIVELNPEESRQILALLFEHSNRPEFQCRMRWKQGSVAFWDNRSTIHKGVFDFGDAHRLMHRVSINDDQRPV